MQRAAFLCKHLLPVVAKQAQFAKNHVCIWAQQRMRCFILPILLLGLILLLFCTSWPLQIAETS